MTSVDNHLRGRVDGNAVLAGTVHGGVHLYTTGQVNAAMVPPPAQLPPAPHLVDRFHERAVLDGLLAPREEAAAAPMVLLAGAAGMGKSALAASWAAGVRERFSTGQMHASMRDLAVVDVAPMFLRALGVPPERVPVTLPEQLAQYRTLTASAKLLVLLDDITDPVVVEQLRPASPHSLVLATGREVLPELLAAGAVLLRLNPLSTQDSIRLLAAMNTAASADPGGAHRLAVACAGVPQALRLAAARLVADPALSPSDLADLHKPDPNPVGSIADRALERALTMSTNIISEPAERMLRLASWHAGPHLTVVTAAAAGETDPDCAQSMLDQLVNLGLLDQRDTGDELRPDHTRYVLSNEAQAYFRRRSLATDSAEERAAALVRIAEALCRQAAGYDYSLNQRRPRHGRAARSYRLPVAPPYSRADALAWFDAEWTNLIAAQRTVDDLNPDLLAAVARAEPDLDPIATVWEEAELLRTYAHRQRIVGGWIEVLQRGVPAAVACGHQVAVVRLRCMLVDVLLAADQATEALEIAALALLGAEAVGDPALRATALSAQAKAALAVGDLQLAEQIFEETVASDAHAAQQDPTSQRGLNLHRRRLGEVRSLRSKHGEAIAVLELAKAGMAESGDDVDRGRVQTVLGAALARAGDLDRAETELAQALAVVLASGTPRYLADVHYAQAMVRLGRGDTSEARQLAEQALEEYGPGGDPRTVRQARKLLGQIPSQT
jgi:tetratricopeptide (TPR) repeat protein